MSIGTPAQPAGTKQGEPISSFIARNNPTVFTSVPAAQAAGNEVNSGGQKAVIPEADSTTQVVPPVIPGSLQMQKQLLIVPGQPIPGKVLP